LIEHLLISLRSVRTLVADNSNPNMPIGEVAYRICRNEPVVCDHNVLAAARAFLASVGGYFGIGATTGWWGPENRTVSQEELDSYRRPFLLFDQLSPEEQAYIRAYTPMLQPQQGEQHQQAQEGRRG
jgi:hypothetical protein